MPHISDFMDPTYTPGYTSPAALASDAFGLSGHAVYTPKPLPLDTWILKQLRRDAREWRYHKQLRALGKHDEARHDEAIRYERRAIREAARDIRRIREEGVEHVALHDGQVSYVRFNRKPFADGGSEQTSITTNRDGNAHVWTELYLRYHWEVRK